MPGRIITFCEYISFKIAPLESIVHKLDSFLLSNFFNFLFAFFKCICFFWCLEKFEIGYRIFFTLVSETCLHKKRLTNRFFLSSALNLGRFIWTCFYQDSLSDGKVEQDKKTGNRSCEMFLSKNPDIMSVTCLKTCHRFCFPSFNLVLLSCLKTVQKGLSRENCLDFLLKVLLKNMFRALFRA